MTAENPEMTEEQRRRSERAKEGWKKRRARKEQNVVPVPEDEPDLSSNPEPVEVKAPEVKPNLEKQDKRDAASIIPPDAHSDGRPASEAAFKNYLNKNQNAIVVHFVDDGFTSNGKVYYRGESIAFRSRESASFKATLNINGQSWVDMSKSDQIDRYGAEKFAPGPWPYPSNEVTDEEYMQALSEGDREAILKLEKKKQRADLNGPKDKALAGF